MAGGLQGMMVAGQTSDVLWMLYGGCRGLGGLEGAGSNGGGGILREFG